MMKGAAICLVALFATSLVVEPACARSLTSSSSQTLHIPANTQTLYAAEGALDAALPFLVQYGAKETSDGGYYESIQDIAYQNAAYSAQQAVAPVNAGQSSATYAAIASAGVGLMTAAGNITSNSSQLREAAAAYSRARTLTTSIRDKEILKVSAAQFANLGILGIIGKDVNIVLGFQNTTTGLTSYNNQTTITGELYSQIRLGVSEGASNHLAVLAAQIVSRIYLSAIYSYTGNASALWHQNFEMGKLMLEAANFKEAKSACQVDFSTGVEPLLLTVFNVTADTSPQGLQASVQACQAVLNAANCATPAPVAAPATSLPILQATAG